MLKKILIGFGVLLLILLAGVLYLNNRNRTLSPPGNTENSVNGMTVSVEYSRPSVRDRLIFGPEADGALQPYGKYWRLGANEPTKLTVDKDFKFGDVDVNAGTYDIYAIPGEKEFKLALNSADRFWGYTEPNYDNDVASVMVEVTASKIKVEQFTITAVTEGEGVNLVFMWSDRVWKLPITPQ